MNYALYFMYSMIFNIIVMALLIMAGKPFIWSLKVRFAQMGLKTNMGFLFLKNKANSFDLPEIVDLRKDKYIKKMYKQEYSWVLEDNLFSQGFFMGKPFAMFSYDDSMNAMGIYYQDIIRQVGEDGKYYPALKYNEIKDKEGNVIAQYPALTEFKPAYRVDPKLMTSLAVNDKVDRFMKMLKDNKILLFAVFGACGLAALAAYFGYETVSTQLPQILGKLDKIIGLLGGANGGGA